MDELVKWLRAQLETDERIVGQALNFADADWRVDETKNVVTCPLLTSSGRQEVAVTADRWRYPRISAPGVVPHVAEHDPARVLREIDAKRQIIDQCAYWNERAVREAVDPPKFPQPGLDLGLLLDAMTPVLRLLALPYADRPGYREEWRP